MSHDVPFQYESFIRLPCSGQENTEGDGDPYLSLELNRKPWCYSYLQGYKHGMIALKPVAFHLLHS